MGRGTATGAFVLASAAMRSSAVHPILRAVGQACATLAAVALLAWPAGAEGTAGADQGAGAIVNYPSLQLRGFTNFDYTASDAPNGATGFDLGQFVLHLVSSLDRKVNYFGEVSVTPRSSAYSIEVERSFVRYDHNDAFKVSAGRFHTQIGYWNTAFHHGLWLQTTVSRPEQIRFGTVFVPVHFVGALVEGKIPSGAAGLGYSAGVGNGRSEILSRAGDAGDPNPNRAWIVQLMARPTHLYGLEAGTSVYRDRLSPASGPGFEEWIVSGYGVLTRESPELLAEGIAVRHENAAGSDFESYAYYLQTAYRLPGGASALKPYIRYEHLDIASGEPVFALPDEEVVIGGMRVDLVDLAAIKVEYRNQLTAGTERSHTFLVQTSLTF